MRIAAIVPTRNRAATASRAIVSFLEAIESCGLATHTIVLAVDDSDDQVEAVRLEAMLEPVLSTRQASLEILRRATGPVPQRTIDCPGGGPGAARNRGLTRLRQLHAGSDVIVMFDDDVCFADVDYRDEHVECDGAALMAEAIHASSAARSIIGCGYVGRQDLSILEHARLDIVDAGRIAIAPATDRATVEAVAPGGISTAFLVTRAPAGLLPDFPEHYNEDYVWLHALNRAGWTLHRADRILAHAPPGEVSVTAPALSFQIFGEIVWLAVLEQERFPIASSSGLAAAVREITGDLREALAADVIRSRPAAAKVISDVLERYDRIERGLIAGGREPITDALRLAIRNGIALGAGPPA